MKNFILFLIICVPYSNYGISDIDKMQLKGKVKSLIQTPYNIAYEGSTIKHSEKITDFFYENFNLKFNIAGYLTREIEFNTKVKYIYKYYDQFNREKLYQKKYYNYFHKLVLKKEFIYNKSGKLSKRIGGYILDKSTYKYDSFGNLIEFIAYESENKIDGMIFNKYDSNNQLIESQEYYDLETPSDKILFFYNNENQLIKTEKYNKHNLLNSIKKYKNKVCISYKWLSYNDNLEVKESNQYIYKYQFDSQMNWVKRITILNDVPNHISIRRIKYYK
jgi:hypothetical protein